MIEAYFPKQVISLDKLQEPKKFVFKTFERKNTEKEWKNKKRNMI